MPQRLSLTDAVLVAVYRRDPVGLRLCEIASMVKADARLVESVVKELESLGFLVKDANSRYHINYENKEVLRILERLARKEKLVPPSRRDLSILIEHIRRLMVPKKEARRSLVRNIIDSDGVLIAKLLERLEAAILREDLIEARELVSKVRVLFSDFIWRVRKFCT